MPGPREKWTEGAELAALRGLACRKKAVFTGHAALRDRGAAPVLRRAPGPPVQAAWEAAAGRGPAPPEAANTRPPKKRCHKKILTGGRIRSKVLTDWRR
jgi:hypothetical protein